MAIEDYREGKNARGETRIYFYILHKSFQKSLTLS